MSTIATGLVFVLHVVIKLAQVHLLSWERWLMSPNLLCDHRNSTNGICYHAWVACYLPVYITYVSAKNNQVTPQTTLHVQQFRKTTYLLGCYASTTFVKIATNCAYLMYECGAEIFSDC